MELTDRMKKEEMCVPVRKNNKVEVKELEIVGAQELRLWRSRAVPLRACRGLAELHARGRCHPLRLCRCPGWPEDCGTEDPLHDGEGESP